MDSNEKIPPVYLQPYTQQPGSQSQPAYPAQSGNPSTQQQPANLPQSAQHMQQSTTVVSLGMPASQTVTLPANPRPHNYLSVSICTCLCCVWPIGLAAIVFSCMVDMSYEAGDYAGAVRNSNIAKWLNLVSVFCGIAVIATLFTTLILYLYFPSVF